MRFAHDSPEVTGVRFKIEFDALVRAVAARPDH
jgi:hypothetical protein